MSIFKEVLGLQEVRCFKNELLGSNTYIGILNEAQDCIVIDPGFGDLAYNECAVGGLKPQAILCTHGHFDHIGGAATFQENLDLKTYLSAKDLKTAQSSNFLLMALGYSERIVTPKFDLLEDTEAEFDVGGITVKYHSAPGHTLGSNIIQINNALFTGDTLYSNGMGLSGLPGEDAEVLKETLLRAIRSFPDDYIIFPGHGKAAILGDIVKNNVKLREFLYGLESQEGSDDK